MKKHNDWRLPSVQELLTLVNYNKLDPACNLTDTISDYYWSSSAHADYSNFAWSVSFFSGYSYNYSKNNNLYVRCIRTSKKGKLQWSKTSKEKMTWNEAIEYAKELVAPVL